MHLKMFRFAKFVTSLFCSRLQLSAHLFVTSLYTISSRFPLFHYFIVSLFHCFKVCYVIALYSASAVSSSVCYVTMLFFKVSIVSLSVCYVIALFSTSAVSSSICYVTTLFFKVYIVSLSAYYIIALFSASI